MSEIDNLLGKIDAEIDAARTRVEEFRHEKLQDYQERQERLKSFGKVCDDLAEIWKPRLEALAQKLGDRVKVSPNVTPSVRQAVFHVQSPFARIVMTFWAAPDDDVRNLVLRYDLDILPILMKFKNSDQLQMPLDKIDREAIGEWLDDRILDFVRTYLQLHQDEHYLGYLKEYMVEDPIAGVKFPQYAAAATCERDGKTHYFIAEETCQEFRKKYAISK